MPSFDYISSADFRASLASDYNEMQTSAESGAWKSAQVLAGSIVECLLVDYIASTPKPSRPQKDPLKLDLGEAIAICKAEGAISERTADLCSVVRSYRNLIHPGRMIRLGEEAPNKTSCDIAVALIDLIVADISRTRRAAVGLTAEQILSKIIRDAGSINILGHLLLEVSEEQRLRLILDLIPEEFLSRPNDDPFDDVADRLEEAHRIAFESVPAVMRERVSRQFVKILKEADGDRVTRYRDAFFRAADMQYLGDADLSMVKEHLLGSPSPAHSASTLKVAAGIGPYLAEGDALKWFDPIIKTMLSPAAPDFVKRKARETFTETISETQKGFDAKLSIRINDWVAHFEKQSIQHSKRIAEELQEELQAFGAPSAT